MILTFVGSQPNSGSWLKAPCHRSLLEGSFRLILIPRVPSLEAIVLSFIKNHVIFVFFCITNKYFKHMLWLELWQHRWSSLFFLDLNWSMSKLHIMCMSKLLLFVFHVFLGSVAKHSHLTTMLVPTCLLMAILKICVSMVLNTRWHF